MPQMSIISFNFSLIGCYQMLNLNINTQFSSQHKTLIIKTLNQPIK